MHKVIPILLIILGVTVLYRYLNNKLKTSDKHECSYCNSTDIKKKGTFVDGAIKRTIYECDNCNKTMTIGNIAW